MPRTRNEDIPQHIKGYLLLEAVVRRCKEEDLDLKSVITEELAISYQYWKMIQRGDRPVSAFSKDILQRFARFLNIPLINVLVIAEIFSVADWLPPSSGHSLLNEAFASLRQEPLGSPPLDEKVWNNSSASAKVTLVYLYQALSGKTFIPRISSGTSSQGHEGTHVIGQRLLELIANRCKQMGITIDDAVTNHFDISIAYWRNLESGRRDLRQIAAPTMQKIAEFLGVPLIQVYVLSEYLVPEDWGAVHQPLDMLINQIYRAMVDDPIWRFYALPSSEWEATPVPMQVAITSFYLRILSGNFASQIEMLVPAAEDGMPSVLH